MEGVPLHGGNELPITGSHEAVGIIEKVGPDVDPRRFQVGDRVGTLNYYHPCGTCPINIGDKKGNVRIAWTMRRDTCFVNATNKPLD